MVYMMHIIINQITYQLYTILTVQYLGIIIIILSLILLEIFTMPFLAIILIIFIIKICLFFNYIIK
jgi:hypothetical protein